MSVYKWVNIEFRAVVNALSHRVKTNYKPQLDQYNVYYSMTTNHPNDIKNILIRSLLVILSECF